MPLVKSSHSSLFFEESQKICAQLDINAIEKLADYLKTLRDKNGRLFVLGVGGSAGNSSHAVNDFRKLCGIEAYTPVDNVSELTARTNDEGWETVFSEWLKLSKLNSNDALFVLSVGGGDVEKNISLNIVKALDLAQERKAKIFGVIGRETGYAKKVGDLVIVIPEISSHHVTPQSEAFQALVWHCLVSNPKLLVRSIECFFSAFSIIPVPGL